ncbi:hypothetical protein DFA_08149 [Cavenderia fasciculata]|uniref:Nudix hydrolase domain-containing protein n=1 Tax=Cavenderia fasciculata TaxID=261658 RepID=F4Q5A6_CACFS|nr:uncharacterized protein DFA_08149 [Cavenderia fasciculata]EGG17165.1 hypothetical protein DFA_08149 [Cavenderia fasciculata]|eukprot:XP_004355649.1 hypothetical protein DFA_08149 [Cavenderia fasciculata]
MLAENTQKKEEVEDLEFGEIEDDESDHQLVAKGTNVSAAVSPVESTTTTKTTTPSTNSTTTTTTITTTNEINEELSDILTSLADTFITENNFSSFEDLFMFIEEAYWYYIDIHLIQNPRLPKPDFPKFAEQILKNNERLFPLHEALLSTTTYEEMIKRFESFKRLIPRYGSIILNKDMTKVVLVKEQWWGWGFPKGKGKEGETETSSATREVFEEIGYDIGPLIKKEDYIQKETHGVVKKFFVIVGVDEQADFETHTRYEISRIKWHKIEDIPLIHSRASHQFAAIIPYIKSLINWIQTKRKEKNLPPINFDNDKDQHSGGDVDFGSIKRWSQQNKKTKNDGTNPTRAKPHEEDERDVILLNEIEDVKLGEFIQSLKDHLKEIPLKESTSGGTSGASASSATPKLNSNLRKMGSTTSLDGTNNNQQQQFKVLTNNQLNKSLTDMTNNNFYNNQQENQHQQQNNQQQMNNIDIFNSSQQPQSINTPSSAMNELDLINLLSNSTNTNSSQNSLINNHSPTQIIQQRNNNINNNNNNNNNYMNNFSLNDFTMNQNNQNNQNNMMGMNYFNNNQMNNNNNNMMNYNQLQQQQYNNNNNNYSLQQQQQQFYNNNMMNNVNNNNMNMMNMNPNLYQQQQPQNQQQQQRQMQMGNQNQMYNMNY